MVAQMLCKYPRHHITQKPGYSLFIFHDNQISQSESFGFLAKEKDMAQLPCPTKLIMVL